MIRHSFSIMQGIGEKLERRLWGQGLLTWDDFMGAPSPPFISPERKRLMDAHLLTASGHLGTGNAEYFVDALKSGQQWRLYDEFQDEAVYLDIETNGLAPDQGGYTTMVGLYGAREGYRCLIRGEGLTPRALVEELRGCKYMVTFFGSVFDLPFLYRSLPGFKVRIPHFDICMGARKVGLSGGLKAIERELGILRSSETDGLSGYDAVQLWHRARKGEARAMQTLIQYNKEDTMNLRQVAAEVYRRLRASTGIEEYLGGA